MKFNVPISWTVQGHVTVHAESRDEAAEIAESMCRRPMGYYMEGSLTADREGMERVLPRSIENPRNFLQVYVYQGDVSEVEENGDYHILPLKEMDLEDEARETGTLFTDVFYGRLSADGYLDCTPWHWGHTEEEVLDELEDLYGNPEDTFRVIQGGKV